MAGVCCLSREIDSLYLLSISENEIYKRSDVLVVGVSSDPVEKQKVFVEKNKLPVRFLLKKTRHGGMTLIDVAVSYFERCRPRCTQGIPHWTGDVGTD